MVSLETTSERERETKRRFMFLKILIKLLLAAIIVVLTIVAVDSSRNVSNSDEGVFRKRLSKNQ